MADIVTTLFALVLVFVGLPVFLLWLNDRRRRKTARVSELHDQQKLERRILSPDWPAVERQLRRPPPPALRDLYADRAFIVRRDVEYGDEIISFEPLDEEAMLENSRWLGFDAVAIAKNSFGDAIYLRPGPTEPDRVYVTHHDGGDTEILAESVAQMVRALKP